MPQSKCRGSQLIPNSTPQAPTEPRSRRERSCLGAAQHEDGSVKHRLISFWGRHIILSDIAMLNKNAFGVIFNFFFILKKKHFFLCFFFSFKNVSNT